MKKTYLAPVATINNVVEETMLLAGSTNVTVSNEGGKFDTDEEGGQVVNSKYHSPNLWDEEW